MAAKAITNDCTVNLLPSAVTGTVTGDWFPLKGVKHKTIDIYIQTTATVFVEVSNDIDNPSSRVTAVNLTAASGETASIGLENAFPWKYIRARVSAYTAGDVDVWIGA